MTRYVCVHGHFYQPPRENPWLEAVEYQDGAYPYHDWNERITDECYAQNAASRVLDEDGRIAHIVNNYARISFNVGPTLLDWMERRTPDVHDAIAAADRRSAERFGGHGSAMAQAHGHVILPIANPRDRRTQVRWGIADFKRRFGREPEGMWLPETAVCLDSLEALAEHGIAFTILEPHQASRVRPLGDDDGAWTDVADASIDTTMPYLVRLPSGREIAIFFYNGPVSRAVAFEGLLDSGARLAKRLLDVPVPDRDGVLVNIATDGESYGHHHRHGDMALAFALHELDRTPDVTVTNYGQFLALHPPTHEVEIVEETAWSCAHGVERWRSDCGCADGGHPDWSQAWRAPLRAALDWLRDEVEPRFEKRAGALVADPWAARDAYIDVLLDPSPESRQRFLATHRKPGRQGDAVELWKLLELQRHAMLMFTSCGWYFDDLARIEAIQVLRYAGRVTELADDLFGTDLESGFLKRLAEAESNDPGAGDGATIFNTHVRPARVTLEGVAGHYAVSSLFEPYEAQSRVYCYEFDVLRRQENEAGEARLAVAQVRLRSLLTEETRELDIGVIHLGDHNIDAGVRPLTSTDEFEETHAYIHEPFAVANLPDALRRLEERFTGTRFTLDSLFRDDQRRVLRTILDTSIAEARSSIGAIHRSRAPLMRYLTQIGARVPRVFLRAAEVTVNDDLRGAFEDENLEPGRVATLLEDASTWELELDTEGLALSLSSTIERLMDQAAGALREPTLFEHFGAAEQAFFDQAETVIALVERLPFEVDLWRAQNLYFETLRSFPGELDARARAGDPTAAAWSEHIARIGEALNFAPGAEPMP